MSSVDSDCGCESYDEHGKPGQLDASADAFGAALRVAGLLSATVSPTPSFSQGTLAQRAA
jgi:hypothetical protein